VTASGTHRVTHIGICVERLERASAFYEHALGFVETGRLDVGGPATATILGVPGAHLRLVYLERDDLRIELIHHATGTRSERLPRPMDQVGLTHLSVFVDALHDLTGPIEAHGGRVLEDSIVTFEWGNRGVMALDPDGTRIELIERRPA
jgi:glyoxylase I family protein